MLIHLSPIDFRLKVYLGYNIIMWKNQEEYTSFVSFQILDLSTQIKKIIFNFIYFLNKTTVSIHLVIFQSTEK